MKAFMKKLAYCVACINLASGYTEDYSVLETLARDIADDQ